MVFFTEGLLNPLLTPSHLLILLGLGILLGQQAKVKLPWLMFVAAFIIGLIANRVMAGNGAQEQILLSLTLVIGLLALLKLILPAWWLMVLGVVSGLLVGIDSTPIVLPGLALQKIISWQIGAALSNGVVLITISGISYYLRELLQGIPLRIAASWITTAALLVLTLSFVE